MSQHPALSGFFFESSSACPEEISMPHPHSPPFLIKDACLMALAPTYVLTTQEEGWVPQDF